MSLFSRGSKNRTESRDTLAVPFGAYRMPTSTSYAELDLSTAESAMQAVAVGATIDLIASLASELPGAVFSGTGSERQERSMPAYLEDPSGDGQGMADWKYQVIASWLARGNLYAEVLATSPQGYLTQVFPYHPDDVGCWIDEGTGIVQWSVRGRPVTDMSKFIHRRVYPIPGRLLGRSVIAQHAATIGVHLTAERFGLQWFRDGAHPSALLSNTEANLNPGTIEKAKSAFLAALRGTREPLVMGKGWEYKAIQVNAEESQFLATQGYTAAECCRIFGPGFAEVLGYETGGSLTYANRVDRGTDLLTYSINKWLTRLERLINRMLPATQYYKIDRDALLQMTTLDRYKAHGLALSSNWKVINEVRDDEDLAPVEWGAEPMAVQAAQQQADLAQQQLDAQDEADKKAEQDAAEKAKAKPKPKPKG